MSEMITSVRMEQELQSKLAAFAREDSCSVSSIVRRACIEYVNRRERENAPVIRAEDEE